MHHRLTGLTLAACCLCVASAQTPASPTVERVFHLTQNETVNQMNELATTLRWVAGVQQLSSEEASRTVTASGTAGQIAMADWLVRALDVPAAGAPLLQSAAPGTRGEVLRVYFTHAPSPGGLQELVTNVRSVADIQRVFVFNKLHAIALRASPAEAGLADWLMLKLDSPGQNQAPQEYPYASLRGPEVARVFYLTHDQTPRDIQEITTTIRSLADMPRIFIYQPPKAIAMRGPADRVALAQWLVSELDKPPLEPVAPGAHHYELPAGSDNQVRVFYLNPASTGEQRQQIFTSVRTTAVVPRLFIYNSRAALAVRGTVGQVATVERLLDEIHPHGH